MLATPVLCQFVYPVQENSQVGSLVQESFEIFYGFLFSEIQAEFLLNLLVDIAMLDVWDIGIHHKCHQVQYEICTFTKSRERGETKAFEACIVS